MSLSRSHSDSHPRKRHKPDGDTLVSEEEAVGNSDRQLDVDDPEDCCTICLQPLSDRTIIPTCSHEFCFECLLLWTEQSRRCPLCSQNIGEYLIHSIRSRYDYRKRYLTPLRTSPTPLPSQNSVLMQDMRQRTRRRRQDRVWGTRERGAADESDKLERSISKRRWIYENNLYAKHIGSNAYTKYRPYPTPAQFAGSQDLISRTTTFLRRELQVWQGLDVEFLTTLIISLIKSIDIRSESAVKLISEFLDMDNSGGSRRNAEHFTHEVYSYVRSPYRDLFVYDTVVQYDSPPGVSPPPDLQRSHRWRPPSDQPSSLQVYHDCSQSSSCHQRSRSSTNSSSRSPSRQHLEDQDCRLNSPTVPEPEPDISDSQSNSIEQGHNWNHFDNRSDSFRKSSPPACRRTRSPIAKSVKGKERELGKKSSFEIAERCNTSDSPAQGTEVIKPLEKAVKLRPPRHQSILDTVKFHLAKSPANDGARDLKLAPTGSRHGPDDSDTALLAQLSDSDGPSLLSDSQPPSSSIVLPAVSGDGNPHSLEESSATMEARARLLARLNQEKRLLDRKSSNLEHAQDEPMTRGSTSVPDLEAKEAKLRVRARLYSRLAAEKRSLNYPEHMNYGK